MSRKIYSSVIKCKLKKISFDYDVMMASRAPYDIHFAKVIRCEKFHFVHPVVLEEFKHTHRKNCA